MIGHSLSALYDLDHGASLSIVLPAWLKYNQQTLARKLTHFGEVIFGQNDATAAIKAIEDYFHEIGAPVRLSEANIDRSEIQKIAENAVGLARKWGLNSYTQEVIARILEFAI